MSISAASSDSSQIRGNSKTNALIEISSNKIPGKILSSKLSRKNNVLISIIIGGVGVGVITALVIGILFGPIAGLLGFFCGAVIGASLVYGLNYLCRHNTGRFSSFLSGRDINVFGCFDREIINNSPESNNEIDAIDEEIRLRYRNLAPNLEKETSLIELQQISDLGEETDRLMKETLDRYESLKDRLL